MSFPLETKILVVDDMTTMRKLVCNALKTLGYASTTEALDGQDAWKKLQDGNNSFDLIISDWNMPSMTGIELLQKCRSDKKLTKIPFVMLTAEAEQPQVLAALKEGVTNYIIKPFTDKSLKEKLDQAYAKVQKG